MEVMRELRPLLTRIFNESDKLYEKIATLESKIQELTEELNHYKGISGEAKQSQQTKKEPTIIHFDDRKTANHSEVSEVKEASEHEHEQREDVSEKPEEKKRRRGMTEEERRKVKTEQQRLRRQRLKEAANKQ